MSFPVDFMHTFISWNYKKKKGGTTLSLTTEFSTFSTSDLHYYLSDALSIFWWHKLLVAPNMIILKNLLVFTPTISLILFLKARMTHILTFKSMERELFEEQILLLEQIIISSEKGGSQCK